MDSARSGNGRCNLCLAPDTEYTPAHKVQPTPKFYLSNQNSELLASARQSAYSHRSRPKDKNRGQDLNYLREFRLHWTTLIGACLGLALGSSMNHYMLNLFGPPLLAEFGWHKSQFALVGSLSLISLVAVPIAGRFVDRVGPRRAAMVGFTAVPLAYLAFSMMTGSIYQFYGIMLAKNILGILTTTLVFCRVVVERFDTARGLSLSIVMSGAPLIGAIAVPLVGDVVDTHGWRTGYLTLAGLAAFGGIASLTLIRTRQSDKPAAEAAALPTPNAGTNRANIVRILRQPVFLLLVAGMFLVNMPNIIISSQLKLVLLESGAASRLATWLVSLYAVSVVVGRFACGLALDRVSAHKVALVTLLLPALGFVAIASPVDASWVLIASVAVVGLAQGAEGDIGAYLTSRRFSLQDYSFVYSFLIAALGTGTAIGSLVLSFTLHQTDSFNTYLLIAAATTIVGALCFYFTGRSGNEMPDRGEMRDTGCGCEL